MEEGCMSIPAFPTALLPNNPHLDQLRRQAKELRRQHAQAEPSALAEVAARMSEQQGVLTLAAAQCVVARRYSFRSWPRLVHFVETCDTQGIAAEATLLRAAIDGVRLAEIEQLLDANAELLESHVVRSVDRHYRNQRPLAYACETKRLAVVELLLRRGADPFADGGLAFARCAMADDHLPVLRLLFDHTQADANMEVYDWGPLLLYPCECLAPAIIRFLIERGADPLRASPTGRSRQTPLMAVLDTYARSSRQAHCLTALAAGGVALPDTPIMDIHLNRLDRLAERLRADPHLVDVHHDGVAYGCTGGRGLDCTGGTLLHVAAEFGAIDAAALLLQHGAKVNAPARRDSQGRGGQTPLFHAASQYYDWGLAMTRLLLDHGADVMARATVRGSFDQSEDWFTGTAIDYAARFPADMRSPGETVRGVLEARR